MYLRVALIVFVTWTIGRFDMFVGEMTSPQSKKISKASLILHRSTDVGSAHSLQSLHASSHKIFINEVSLLEPCYRQEGLHHRNKLTANIMSFTPFQNRS